ncbi:MAG: glycosyltransferase, partial [Patescibacteria group bacterium]
VDATNAACVLYSRPALDQVGLFDERFGSYLEDIDLSLRLTRAGWQNLVCHEVAVVHQQQASSQTLGWRKNWLDTKNWWLVILKNWSCRQWLKYWPGILLERGRNLSGLIRSYASG